MLIQCRAQHRTEALGKLSLEHKHGTPSVHVARVSISCDPINSGPKREDADKGATKCGEDHNFLGGTGMPRTETRGDGGGS